ncbi:MAG: UbiH/UbiF/VisC/COQ6 family ubiquinone biosynthesis hydroxylase [Rudaea sp.]
MSPRKMHDIAIVGAGMVGAALAMKLAHEGFDVAVIEPCAPATWSRQDDVDLRVVAVAPSSARLFADLDIWPDLLSARACAYRHMRVWDCLAPGELNFDASELDESALGWIVENRAIQHLLWQRLQHDANITLRCPARVSATDADEQRRTLTLDDGSMLSARLVVAADGANSALREMLGIATHERDYAQRALVAHVSTQQPHEFTAWQRFLPGAVLAFLPLADGRSSIVWSLPDGEADRMLALDDAQFCKALGAAFDFRLGTVTGTTPRAAFPLRLRTADRYLAPRFALIGDAAHVVHPLAGQGVNLGLRDVQELAETLIAARDDKRNFAAESTLRKFERRRRSDNTLSAHAFDAIQRVFASQATPLAAVRGIGLAAVSRIGPLKRLFAAHAAGR